MVTAYPYNDFASIERSGNAAVLSIRTALDIRVLLRSLGNVVVTFLAGIVAIPLFILLFGILCFSVWKLGRSKPFKQPLNAGNYKAFRLHYEKISKLSDALEPLMLIDLSKRKWLARIFLFQAVKTARILYRHKNEMASVLKQLDQPFDSTVLPEGWQVFTSDERWASRPKPYEYLV